MPLHRFGDPLHLAGVVGTPWYLPPPDIPLFLRFQACAKWRKMPPGYRADDPRFSGDWYCDMNPNREMAAYGCDAPQEVDEVTTASAICPVPVCT